MDSGHAPCTPFNLWPSGNAFTTSPRLDTCNWPGDTMAVRAEVRQLINRETCKDLNAVDQPVRSVGR